MRAEDFWRTAPPVTFSQDETGDQNLLPRMGVGVDAEGRLLCAAVDGRNEAALGMTLAGLGELMALLGCQDALNLDGGSSKRMCVRGEIVDLPTTEVARSLERVVGPSSVRRIRGLGLADSRGGSGHPRDESDDSRAWIPSAERRESNALQAPRAGAAARVRPVYSAVLFTAR